MTGRHRAELVILSFGGVLLVVLCRALIPSLGQNGAATSVAASFFVINVVRFGYVSKVLGFVPGGWRDLLPPLIGLVLAFVARNVIDLGLERSFMALLTACVVYSALYAVVCQLILFRPATRVSIANQLRGRFSRLRPRWS